MNMRPQTILKRFLVVQNLKITDSSVFIFSKLFVWHSVSNEKLRENEYATTGVARNFDYGGPKMEKFCDIGGDVFRWRNGDNITEMTS